LANLCHPKKLVAPSQVGSVNAKIPKQQHDTGEVEPDFCSALEVLKSDILHNVLPKAEDTPVSKITNYHHVTTSYYTF